MYRPFSPVANPDARQNPVLYNRALMLSLPTKASFCIEAYHNATNNPIAVQNAFPSSYEIISYQDAYLFSHLEHNCTTRLQVMQKEISSPNLSLALQKCRNDLFTKSIEPRKPYVASDNKHILASREIATLCELRYMQCPNTRERDRGK